jgi:peroxiredoxin
MFMLLPLRAARVQSAAARIALCILQPTANAETTQKGPVEAAAWIDAGLTEPERTLLARSVGFAPAHLGGDCRWIEGDPVNWADLRGRVVILQSFTSNDAGFNALRRLNALAQNQDTENLSIIALHTPENADRADQFIQKRDDPFPIALDPLGRFCDDMGIWKEPVTILIDRHGAVRAAGVHPVKLRDAVAALLKEPFDETLAPPTPVTPRAADPDAPEPKRPDFPKAEPRGSTKNLIGKKAPALVAQTWITPQPDLTDKVVLVDFWATWCGPCRQSIPHMNDLAAKFRGRLVAVGLSDEDASRLKLFMKKTKMDYAVATDPQGRLARFTGHSAIPFVIIMSPDRIVRWQGHPMMLQEATLRQIIEASGTGTKPVDAKEAMRWVKG